VRADGPDMTDHDVSHPSCGAWRAYHGDSARGLAGNPPGRAAHGQAPAVFVAGGPQDDEVNIRLLGELDKRPCGMSAANGRAQAGASGLGLLDGVDLQLPIIALPLGLFVLATAGEGPFQHGKGDKIGATKAGLFQGNLEGLPSLW
jgi:hypothetical protein